MATWKKIIVSGSDAHLASITSSILIDNNLVIAGEGGALESSGLTYDASILNIGSAGITSTGTTSILSGSFSGSFQGDGSGLSGLVSTLAIDGDSGGPSTVELLTQTLSIDGTANEIETTVSGQTITIGLPNNVTIGNNLTVEGDFIVNGTASFIHSTELLIEDKFVLLASGSTTSTDGGIIVQTGFDPFNDASGSAFFWDSSAARWGLNQASTYNTIAVTPDAYAAAVVDVDGGQSDTAEYQKTGNIKIESGDIFIYV